MRIHILPKKNLMLFSQLDYLFLFRIIYKQIIGLFHLVTSFTSFNCVRTNDFRWLTHGTLENDVMFAQSFVTVSIPVKNLDWNFSDVFLWIFLFFRKIVNNKENWRRSREDMRKHIFLIKNRTAPKSCCVVNADNYIR